MCPLGDDLQNYNYLMFLLRVILFPFAILYDLITRIRNRLYDLGLKPSVAFDVPIIVVGNLTVGGTGKTPMVEHLVRTFSERVQVATLSRGYGRLTKGMRIANALDDASTIGDEPFQLYQKFGDRIIVSVGEERVLAITHLMDQFPETKLILMDDAFQHRKVKASMNILLSDYHRPFYDDYLLPAGRLRESKFGANRADAIVVTKCPNEISEDEMMEIEHSIRKVADKPVFFAGIRYGNPLPIGDHSLGFQEQVILVTGIANASPLKEYIAHTFELKKHLEFQDHHNYTLEDIQKIKSELDPSTCILTTEKDMMKLDSKVFKSVWSDVPIFYLSIEIDFIKNGEDFDALVQTVLP